MVSATAEIYTLSLHDALPIFEPLLVGLEESLVGCLGRNARLRAQQPFGGSSGELGHLVGAGRSEEHTSELQSREKLVCRLLLEKKNAACCDEEELGRIKSTQI